MSLMSIIYVVAVVGIAYLSYLIGKRRTSVSSMASSVTESSPSALEQMQIKINSLTSELCQTLEDTVTHLPNWKIFQDRLSQQILESARYHFTLGVVCVDINEFKVVNNALGQESGNRLLMEVAKRLQSCIRQVDSVSRQEKDKFVLFLSQLSKPETAVVVAQRILQALAEPFDIDNRNISLTVSMGIAIYPVDGSNAETLLHRASQALAMAKKKGKQQYQFYQQQMSIDSQRELALYSGLSSESIYEQLVLMYQPIVNIHDQSIVCMQALLHWHCPGIGMVSGAELATLLEKQQQAPLIIEWQVRKACQHFLRWRALGFSPALLGISLSSQYIQNTRFIYRLSQILQELDFNPEWLLLAVADDHHRVSFDVLEKAFNRLEYIRIKLAADYFGAGQFSLRYLKHLPVSYLKLDPALISDVDSNQRTLALIESLITLCKNLSMNLIVSGVESSQQLGVLREIGCVLMQGEAVSAVLTEQAVVEKMTQATT